jgi:hypothetical protein
MLEMGADVLRESFKVRLMEPRQHAAALMKVYAVISMIKKDIVVRILSNKRCNQLLLAP